MATLDFPGFSSPHFTQIPDEAFDYLMPNLTPAEWKVLCYIMRRTFGFKKDADTISLTQMTLGIRKADGTYLDFGTGLSRKGVVTCLASLVRQGIVIAVHNSSPQKGNEATTYQLRFSTLSTGG